MASNNQALVLSSDFKYVLDKLEDSEDSLFITGRAGTGKSTLLQTFRRQTRKKCVVLAPTGIAALNVGGQTIHSFFGFPPRMLNPQDITKRRNHRLYKKLELIIIDEISMVRADMLDNIDRFLRINRDNPKPFGGVQVAFFGDLFQLPPVVRKDADQLSFQLMYNTPYFFSSNVIQNGFQLEMVELQKVYRQEQTHFLDLLESVRMNRIDYDTLEALNEQFDPNFQTTDNYINLTARNARADHINLAELGKLAGKPQVYQAKIEGEFKSSLFPTEQLLPLKVDAQVMFLRNDPEGAYVNGTIGKVVELKPDVVYVEVNENNKKRTIKATPIDWEIIRYKTPSNPSDQIETNVIGTFTQMPLRLAWAVTIHKSQGKTFDKVIIDLGKGGAFEHGQTYVALSRCRTLEGIILKQRLRPSDIKTDQTIVDYYQKQI